MPTRPISPAAATLDWYSARQIDQIRTRTAHAVTIPGAVDAWCTLNQEYGTKPLTDDQIAKKLDDAGIHVTRRTVAKYREDMRIPSTHQRRVKN